MVSDKIWKEIIQLSNENMNVCTKDAHFKPKSKMIITRNSSLFSCSGLSSMLHSLFLSTALRFTKCLCTDSAVHESVVRDFFSTLLIMCATHFHCHHIVSWGLQYCFILIAQWGMFYPLRWGLLFVLHVCHQTSSVVDQWMRPLLLLGYSPS